MESNEKGIDLQEWDKETIRYFEYCEKIQQN